MMAEEQIKMSFWNKVLISMLGTAFFLSCLQRFALAVIGDSVIQEFGLTDSQFALLGAAIFYPYSVLQIPSGFISDRAAPRLFMIFSGFAAGLGALCFAVSSGFPMLVTGRLLTGFGTAFIYMPALGLIRRSLGDARYGAAAGLFISIGSIGSIASSVPLRVAADLVGWRAVFIAFAVILIVMGAVSLFVLPKGGTPERKAGSKASRAVLSPGFLLLVIWFMALNGTSIAFSSLWGGRFYRDTLSLSPMLASVCLLSISLGSVFGSVIFGRIADKIGTVRSMIAASVLTVASWLMLGQLGDGSGVVLASLVSFMHGFANTGGSAAGFAAVKLFVPPQDTGLASGLSNGSIYVGSAIFSQMSGTIMGFASGGSSFSFLFTIYALLLAAATAVFVLYNRGLLSK